MATDFKITFENNVIEGTLTDTNHPTDAPRILLSHAPSMIWLPAGSYGDSDPNKDMVVPMDGVQKIEFWNKR